MTKTLKDKTKLALAWNLFDKFGQQAIMFVVAVILARTLSVDDWGLTGMLAIFIALSTVISDSGFSYALIKKQAATQDDYNAVFYFNLVISVVLYLILFFAAPYIAVFYNQPQLTVLSRVLFLSIIFNAAGSIQSANFIKNMQFKAWAKINIAALLVSSVITLVCAFNGLGVWSLVVQRVGGEFFRTLFLWGSKNWFPTFSFQINILKSFFSFSSHLLVFRIINEVFNNLYSVAIGKVFSTTQVGYYTQAGKLRDMAITSFGDIYRNIVMPMLSEVGDDIERFRRVFRKMVKNVAFLIFPLSLWLIIVAKPIVAILIGDKWLPSVPVLQVLSIAGALNVIVVIFFEMFAALGHSNLYLKLELYRKPLVIIGIFILIHKGIIALAWLWLGYTAFSLFLSVMFSSSTIKYRFTDLFADIIPSIFLAVIIATPVYFLSHVISNIYLLVISQSVLFWGLFILLSHVFKIEEYQEFKALFMSIKNKLNVPL